MFSRKTWSRAVATAAAAAIMGVGMVAAPAVGNPTPATSTDEPKESSAQVEEDSTDDNSDQEAAGNDAEAVASEAPTQAQATALSLATEVFISELHYDNVSTDVGEAIEIEGPVGTDLTGWSVVLYNGGTNGANRDAATTYGSTQIISEVIGESGVVVLYYPQDGIQNGPFDGIALVDAEGSVVEFISYEGVITAANGPAAGETSTDIGVEQPSNTPVGESLQRIDGVWQANAPNTFGQRNTADAGGGDGDGDGEEPPSGDVLDIADIQGTGDTTPYNGQVVTTRGIVTAAYPSGAGNFAGFFIQTPGTGGEIDPATHAASDAIFVYDPAQASSVEPGQYVEVTGTAGEFRASSQISLVGNGTITHLDEEVDPVDPVANFRIPATAAEREAYEGMLLDPADNYAITNLYDLGGWGNNSNRGQIALGLDGPLLQETDHALPGTAEYDELVADNAARSVVLDDAFTQSYNGNVEVPYLTGDTDLRVGATLDFEQPVILRPFEETSGQPASTVWYFQPLERVTGAVDWLTVTEGGRDEHAVPPVVAGDLTVATFNVLNYFTTLGIEDSGCTAYTDRAGNPLTVNSGCLQRGAWDSENLERQETKIVEAINALDADVVGIQEIENSVKFGKDRDDALATLVAALNEASAPGTWAYVPSPPTADLPALADQDVIRNAFIYQPASVTPEGDTFVNTDQSVYSNAREPIVQEFSANGADYSFLVANNHFKSKGGTCGSPPEGCFNADRVNQANALADFTAGLADELGVEDVFLLGDFNSYAAEEPVVALETAGFINVNESRTASYSYQGKVGSLDHIFANAAAGENVADYGVWQINAGESVLAEYSRLNYFASDHYDTTFFRSSDHNPIIVGIEIPEVLDPPVVRIDLLSINDFHGRLEANYVNGVAGAAVLACAVNQYRAANPNTVFVSAGDNIGASTFTSAVAQDQPTLEVLNAMGLDVSALGNHEFDQGRADVDDRVVPASDFPWIGANIYDTATGERAYDPYYLHEVGGVTIGFIGAITEDMPGLVAPDRINTLEWRDMSDEVNAVAAELTDGNIDNGEADVLVVLVHEGAASADLSALGGPFGKLVNDLPEDVVAVISGHSHQVYAEQVNGVWVTQSGQYSENLGRMVIDYNTETGEVLVHSVENIDLVPGGVPLCAPDPDIATIVSAAAEEAAILGAVPIGATDGDLLRATQPDGNTENRGGESTIGNWLSDVYKWAAEQNGYTIDVAFMNPGGIRDDIWYAGDTATNPLNTDGVITYQEAAIVQPFANTLMQKDYTGAQLRQILEEQWHPTPESASRPFLKLGVSEGFKYTYDPTAERGERIQDVWINGELIDDDATYSVLSNSFLIAGGDGFVTFAEGGAAVDTGWVDLAATIEYFQARDGEPISPPLDQRSIGITWISDPSASYEVGDEIAFDTSSWSFTNDEPKAASLTASINGVDLGTFELDHTVVLGFDEAGAAQIRVTLTDELAELLRNTASDANGYVLVLSDGETEIGIPLALVLGSEGTPPPSGGGDPDPDDVTDPDEIIDPDDGSDPTGPGTGLRPTTPDTGTDVLIWGLLALLLFAGGVTAVLYQRGRQRAGAESEGDSE